MPYIAYESVCELETQSMISGDVSYVKKESLGKLKRRDRGYWENAESVDQIPDPSLRRICIYGGGLDLMEQIIFYGLYPLGRVGDFKSSGVFIATLIHKVDFYDGLVQVNAF